jgi:hypothetical protein
MLYILNSSNYNYESGIHFSARIFLLFGDNEHFANQLSVRVDVKVSIKDLF